MSDLSLSTDPLPPGEVVLKYTVLGLIAEGGMAEVYLARDEERAAPNDLVVLKRVRPHLLTDPRFETMFDNEARLASMIDHPNVVQVLGVERSGQDLFLVMEFLNGKTLLAVGKTCDTAGFWVPPRVLARIVADSAAGLHHAHTLKDGHGQPLNLVHRDMSPENVIITYQGLPKLVDFGVAKARLTPDTTQLGVVKGKLNYLSLEAVQGQPLDARADIYALGVTLYLFLTARFPFVAAAADELMDLMYSAEPTPPREVNPEIPEEMEAICLRCLEKNRERRYDSAEALRQALEAFLARSGTPTSARHVAAFMNQLYPRESDPMRCWLDAVTDGVEPAVVPEEAPPEAVIDAPVMKHGGTVEMDAADEDGPPTLDSAFAQPPIWSAVTDIHKRAAAIRTNLEASGLHVQRPVAPQEKPAPKSEATGMLPGWRPPAAHLRPAVLTTHGARPPGRRTGAARGKIRAAAFLLSAGGLLVGVVIVLVLIFSAPTPGLTPVAGPGDTGRTEDAGLRDVRTAPGDAAIAPKPKKKKWRKKRRKKRRKRPPRRSKSS